jgi:DNA mismatch repair protein MutL
VPIRLLSDEIASQIAAGEVVDRPASVVKELLENALDAGAARVAIRVEGAGLRLIEVLDDGLGIPIEELPLAVTRHATSKLNVVEDLGHIATLGFRGEALAAIASVSRLTLISHIIGVEAGAQVLVDAGKASQVMAVGAPQGTSVRVEDLFFNVPARRKFLKSEMTERRHIANLVTRYALAYPRVRISLEMEGRIQLQTSGNGEHREVLAALYGHDLARRMLEVDAAYDEARVFGFLGPTDATRANRGELTFFVNGRWVQEIALGAAVVQGYHGMLMVGRYPMAVLFIEVAPELVDVNVHPTKAEVRFVHRDQVFSAVQRAVRRALLAHAPVPDLAPGLTWLPLADNGPGAWRPDPQQSELDLDKELAEEEQDAPAERPKQSPLPHSGVSLFRLVGQVGSAYLVAEAPDGLYLIDQHAAHERVLYERFQAQGKQIQSQILLEPATVELEPAQAELLASQLPVVRELGFEVEPFGPNAFKLRAMPSVLQGSDPEAALRVIVEDFEEDEAPLEAEIEARLIARVCKRAAVKAGQRLSMEEQEALLRDLEACQAPRSCPHGRPTMIHLSVDLLEKQFGRRGAR